MYPFVAINKVDREMMILMMLMIIIMRRWSNGVLTANVENFVETPFNCIFHNVAYQTRALYVTPRKAVDINIIKVFQ